MYKKIPVYIFVFILVINSIGIVVSAYGGKTIRVYGRVTIDDEGVEDAYITVEDMYDHDTETTQTNSTGHYEVYIYTSNGRDIKVSVEFDEYENDETFEVECYKSNYEVNFEFESSPTIVVVSKFVDWCYGFDLLEFLCYFILILCILCLCKKLLWENNKKKK